ncbi:Crp/Fnr family transcriptional regulator [Flagellimonas sediminis]|uniref:Cyclic nucleotide-binding domain-containing protein n=1 Tax=Flagellimonas sediminis TaxID=2696468 RepID=A0A6I5L0Z3_9FLAO|nr:Crp/Fnr family transcriptional regulator [Allomuricauda sediminis]NDV43858.1 cyclic nucleotide-binding domain-containing protein [Allomuricauda sediminis]
MTTILRNIEKHVSLGRSETETLLSFFQNIPVSKKELIIHQGRLCDMLFFVESGSFRAYHLNKDGKESTIMFAPEDWWVTDMNAFLNGTPSLLSLEALEDSKIYAIGRKNFDLALDKIPQLERFFRILFQRAYIREQLRVLDNISLTTEERYLNFISKYPQLVQKVTQKQIASYLGVTPEFLSSLKKK